MVTKQVIHEVACQCGVTVSGPNLKSVEETMARHEAKTHPKGAKK